MILLKFCASCCNVRAVDSSNTLETIYCPTCEKIIIHYKV